MAEKLFARFTFAQLLFYALGAAAVLLVLGYGLFEARKLIEGPEISILSPEDGSAVGGPLITVRGTVANAAFFTVDGRQVFADQYGNFSETFSPPPGYADIQVAAKDRFGRVKTRDIEITVLAQCLAS